MIEGGICWVLKPSRSMIGEETKTGEKEIGF